MKLSKKDIDKGKPFDFGKTSKDYGQYRDIYPSEFYQAILNRKLCVKNQNILDVGTGTGVIPRNLYKFGADWSAVDISPHQIAQAISMSSGKNIKYSVTSVEEMKFPEKCFDIVTASQCFTYFNHKITAKKLNDILVDFGVLFILYMAWLPNEDYIAKESEKLILKFNPVWSGCNEDMHPIQIPKDYYKYFNFVWHDEFKINLSFTRQSWTGRLKTCRGIGASLSEKDIRIWESEQEELLNQIAPKKFEIPHYCAFAELRKKPELV